jgi:hypothetical protein
MLRRTTMPMVCYVVRGCIPGVRPYVVVPVNLSDPEGTIRSGTLSRPSNPSCDPHLRQDADEREDLR